VQVTVWFGREAGLHLAAILSLGEVVHYDLFYKVETLLLSAFVYNLLRHFIPIIIMAAKLRYFFDIAKIKQFLLALLVDEERERTQRGALALLAAHQVYLPSGACFSD
jgi:hypothetical protein